ncbi:MAG: CC0125/CC1285 family lipoprotein, partial [Oceanococcaceae bacterium]
MSAFSPSLMTALLATSLLVACAHTPTPYQPRPDGGQYGYSEQGLEPDRIRVVFRGNTLTARETVENYLLYRAAEVTQQRGYAYFSPMQQEVEREGHWTNRVSNVNDRDLPIYQADSVAPARAHDYG